MQPYAYEWRELPLNRILSKLPAKHHTIIKKINIDICIKGEQNQCIFNKMMKSTEMHKEYFRLNRMKSFLFFLKNFSSDKKTFQFSGI